MLSINKEILESNNHHLIRALKNLRYNFALNKYFDSLIILIRKIKELLENNDIISPTRIVNELNLPFGRKIVGKILKALKYNFPEEFKK